MSSTKDSKCFFSFCRSFLPPSLFFLKICSLFFSQFYWNIIDIYCCCSVAQLCPTLRDPTDCSTHIILYNFIYLCMYLFGCAGSLLWHAGSSVFIVAPWISSCHLCDLVSWPEMESGPPGPGILATGPPGKSLTLYNFKMY